MKRSKSIRLIALGSLPLALAACSGERPSRLVSESKRYQDANLCVLAGNPYEVCNQAHEVAYRYHRENAPRFKLVDDCLASFNVCEPLEVGVFIPRMEGFALTVEREVYDDSSGSSSSSSSFSGGGGGGGRYEYTSAEPRYSSEAMYHERVGRDEFKVSTLTDQANNRTRYTGLATGAQDSNPFSRAAASYTGLTPGSLSNTLAPRAVGSHAGFGFHASGYGGFGS